MAGKRIRIGRLDTAGGIAYEHGKILKKLMREMIDPHSGSRERTATPGCRLVSTGDLSP